MGKKKDSRLVSLEKFFDDACKAIGSDTYVLANHESIIQNKTDEEKHIIGVLKRICEETLAVSLTLVTKENK